MKKFISTLFLYSFLAAQAQTSHLVISQVYGAGGNTGALYKYDFVELYNPTTFTISLAGWSLQYAGATSTNWNSNKTNLSGSVAPGKYFLVQLGNPGTEGTALPTADLASTAISIATTGGKIALVNNTTLLTGNCPLPNPAIVDFVAFGGADCSETAPATGPVSSNTTSSVMRLNNGCTDVDNNSTDFVLMTVSPRNSRSNGHTCNGTSINVGAVTPNPFCVDANNGAAGMVNFTATGTFSNSTFKAMLSDANGSFGYATVVGSATVSGTNPSGSINITIPPNITSSTGYKIRIEATNPPLISTSESPVFEIINGAKNLLANEFSAAANNTTMTLYWTNPSGCFEEILIVAKEGSSISGTPTGDGSAYTADLDFLGNGTPFDGGKVVYKGTARGQTVTHLTNGTTYFFKAYTRRGTNWSSGTEVSEHPRIVPLAGEIIINQLSPGYNTASDEYFELVNLTDKPFDLADVAIRQADATGTNGVAGKTLSGIIQPHSFWLASPNAIITVGQTTLLARDNAIDAGFLATNNQVGLVRKTDNTLLDAVGYGTISNKIYTEGTPAANPQSKSGLKRTISGVDNNNNSVDFSTVANANIELRNSNSRLANAGAIIASGSYATLEITGNSTLAGSIILSNKVVLTKGLFTLNDYDLTTAAISAGSESNYIKTSGSGALAITNVTTDITFPVGNSTYNPVTVNNGDGLTWSVTVSDALPANTPFNKEYAVQRTWNVTPSATPSSGATVVFEYNDNDATQLGQQFDKTKAVQVWNDHNGIWQAVTGPLTPVATPSGRKAVTLSGYTRFSPFAIVNVNAPLPVHFTDVTARAANGGVQLQFTNALEEHVAHYVIERASDGQLFQTLMVLQSERNDGSTVTYRWFDAAPLTGNAWYRVKGVDQDGTVRYSPVLKINIGKQNEALTVYPNPVHGRTLHWQAALPTGSYLLQLSNGKGQQVLRQTFEHSGGTRSETLHLPASLATGVYQLRIGNGAFVRKESIVIL